MHPHSRTSFYTHRLELHNSNLRQNKNIGRFHLLSRYISFVSPTRRSLEKFLLSVFKERAVDSAPAHTLRILSTFHWTGLACLSTHKTLKIEK